MNEKHRLIAWQGWTLQIPRRWDPVKLEGDSSHGHALFADSLRPRLGLAWQTLKKKPDPAEAVQKAMRTEVGQLAADEASDYLLGDSGLKFPLLYREPDPPGRDVFCCYSPLSKRLLQVVYHAHRRENLFAATMLPMLGEVSLDRAAQWSIFDLNCVIPAGMHLKSQRLNAGDLGLTFADRFNEITIRQIAVAQLALQRQPIDAWIADQQKTTRRFHQATGRITDLQMQVGNVPVTARVTTMLRRLRYCWMWDQPKSYATIAAHNVSSDRLILLHGTDASLLEVIADSVGVL